MLSASADFHQSHSLFNPVKPVAVLACNRILGRLSNSTPGGMQGGILAEVGFITEN
jgi:hypothetical protein